MEVVAIFSPIVKKTIAVKLLEFQKNKAYKAFLLGSSGEKLKTFLLTEQNNELSLDDFIAGIYTLRIEMGNNITVKQIIIPQ